MSKHYLDMTPDEFSAHITKLGRQIRTVSAEAVAEMIHKYAQKHPEVVEKAGEFDDE